MKTEGNKEVECKSESSFRWPQTSNERIGKCKEHTITSQAGLANM